MRILKTSLVLILLSFVSQCSSSKQNNKLATQDLQTKSSFSLGETSYKHWVAGVKGGGSGITVLIPITSNINNVTLDSIYFRGIKTKLESTKTGYVANFKTQVNKRDLPAKNNLDDVKKTNTDNSIFKTKDNECIISYLEDSTTKFLKIENMVKKSMDLYPSVKQKHSSDN